MIALTLTSLTSALTANPLGIMAVIVLAPILFIVFVVAGSTLLAR